MLVGLCWGAVLRAQPPADALTDLPVRFAEPDGPSSKEAIVLLSGDGGFATLVSELGAELARHGYGVVTLNSRAYLSRRKDPAQVSADVSRLARAAMRRWHADSFLLVGYSRGADLAPFAANRFPEELRAKLSGLALFGLAPAASFEFHLIDLVKDTKRDSDVPVLPELERLKGLPMLCGYGVEEAESACRDAPAGLLESRALDGGHHLDGDYRTLASLVLDLAKSHRERGEPPDGRRADVRLPARL